MKTRSYLTAIILIVLLPLLALSAWGLSLLLQDEKEARLQAVAEKANSVALSIDKEFAKAEGALRVIAQTDAMASEDYASLHALMRKTITSENSWGVLFDDAGRMLLHTHLSYGKPIDQGPNPWVLEAIARGEPSVSNLRPGRAGKSKVVSVQLPVKTPSGRTYLLAYTFNNTHITALLRHKDLPDTWVIGVFGADGISIARNVREHQFVGTPVRPELFQAAQRQFSGRIINRTRDGFMAYNSFTHTSRAAWTVAIAAPRDEINSPARNATWFAAVVLLIALGCAGAGIVVFARRITGSYQLTLAAAKTLEVGGIPAPVRSGVLEADLLQTALHDAGVKLARENEARQALERERETLLASERDARREAENQNHAKDEFLAMLAHELRNPLAPISAAAQTLGLQINNERAVRRAGDVIVRQVDHLKSLINDLLDVSRVTRGLVSIEQDEVKIGAIAGSAVEQAQPLIQARGHRLEVQVRCPQARVRGDRVRLIQVLSNLLNNAAKYTPSGGAITLTVDTLGSEAVIEVADNGMGIDAELLPHVFDLFRQASRSSERSQGGLGLGLALVRSIMALHGGRVEAHSEGLGQGARFTLFLPLLAQGPGQAGNAAVAATAPPAPVRLMIVDDNLDAARALANLLEAKGHSVAIAGDAQAALGHGGAEAFAVYILDIGLPGMDGYELARRLRSAAGGRVVLVALTGYGQAQDIHKAYAAGFDHHFVKPIDIEALDRILAAAAVGSRLDSAVQP
ncbi:ATP-binding protein [Massilia sp. AB1]|uniref:hybrid sensor histidine kinase/response regulator n=1 Tax=Massilia sp. AB1 TaxID=2823371 RepID=UPI001B84451A|nr:ATP-binding protein [Massilia sp. AB1]MBQ5939084.1 response regulator [Massilia sp. AB1]